MDEKSGGAEPEKVETKPVVSLTEDVLLPSRGLLYGGKQPEGKVTVLALKMTEEKMLADPGRDRNAVLNDIIQRSTEGLNIPFNDLLLNDKLFLLFAVRIVSYGSGFEFNLRCPKCTAMNRYEVDLSKDLVIRILTPEDTEPFFVDLPIAGVKLGLRYLRIADELEIERFVKQHLISKSGGDVAYSYRLARLIVSMDDQPVAPLAAMQFVDGLYSRDSYAISDALADADFGVNLRIEKPCGRCGAVIEELFPFSADFFRPKRTVSRRT